MFKTIIFSTLLCLTTSAQTITSGITITSGANLISPAASPPVTGWALQGSIPPGFNTDPGSGIVQFAHQVTGDLFYMALGGSLAGCTATTSISWSVASSGTWTDITGDFPNTASCIRGVNIWPNADGTVVVYTGTITPSFSVTAYNWNGLTGGSSHWTHISCGPGQCGNSNLGSSKNFTKDGFFLRADNVLCTAGGSDIYCQTTANGTAWLKQTSGLGMYAGTGHGAASGTACAGQLSSGFVYGMDDFDTGDGRGEQAWGGGEGDQLQFSPYTISTLASNFLFYVPDPNDCVQILWHGDDTGIVHSPTSALIWRGYNGTSTFTGSFLAKVTFNSGSPPTITPIAKHPLCTGGVSCVGFRVLSPLLYAGGTGSSSRYIEFAASTNYIFSPPTGTASIWYTQDNAVTFTNIFPAFQAVEPNCTNTGLNNRGVTDRLKLYVNCKNTVTGLVDYWTYTF